MKKGIIYSCANALIVLMSTMIVTSCATDEAITTPTTKRIVEVAYSNSTQKFIEINTMLQNAEFGEIMNKQQIVSEVENAVSEFNKMDIEVFLLQNNISLDIYDACCFYAENVESSDILNRMEQYFPDFTLAEFEQVFDIYYVSKIMGNDIMMSRGDAVSNQIGGDVVVNDELAKQNKLSTGCVIAVSGAVVTCVSAVTIGNVAGLAWWLASYSTSLAGVIASCS